MFIAQIRAIWPATRIWLLVAIASLGCIFFGRTYERWDVWWLCTVGCWFVLDLYWAAAASQSKGGVAVSQNRTILLITLLIYALYCLPLSSVPVLGQRVVPDFDALRVLGAMMCAFGVWFAIWSRHALAGNWRADAARGDGHSLIQHGPYSIVRHPIYFGFLSAVIGMVLVLGEVRAFALLFGVEVLLRKMTLEENILRNSFPNQYPEYEQKVSRLLPWIW